MIHHLGQETSRPLKALEAVRGQEMINIGHGHIHSPADGLVIGIAGKRIQPYHGMRLAVQQGHFPPQKFLASQIPAIA